MKVILALQRIQSEHGIQEALSQRKRERRQTDRIGRQNRETDRIGRQRQSNEMRVAD